MKKEQISHHTQTCTIEDLKRTKTILKILLNQQIVGRRILIKNRVNGVDDFTKFETKNVGSPKHDTAVNTNSGNNKGGVKPPCLTVVPTNENKTGITDRNTRTNDQPQNQTSIVNATVSP
jgi:hypothetical protein